MDASALAIVTRQSGSRRFDVPATEFLDQMLTRAQGESHDADRRGLVGAIEKNAGVAGV